MTARLYQISISRGGVPKLPIPHARITTAGVEGDRQHDTRHHGGPDRAVCVFSLDVIRRLQVEGHPIVPGSVGENLGLFNHLADLDDWPLVLAGTLVETNELAEDVFVGVVDHDAFRVNKGDFA